MALLEAVSDPPIENGAPERLPECWVFDLGDQKYESSLITQSRVVELRKARQLPDCLLLLQYSHTITLGRSGNIDHLRVSSAELRDKKVAFFHTDRGGDITYHGPGQLVVYPVLDLKQHRRDIDWYLRSLEATIVKTLVGFGIEATRHPGATGVWVGDRKIAAIGVRTSSWVTSHGIALNVCPDLSFFDLIVPCGISGKGVTSMAEILQTPLLDLHQVRSEFCSCFAKVFRRSLRFAMFEASL